MAEASERLPNAISREQPLPRSSPSSPRGAIPTSHSLAEMSASPALAIHPAQTGINLEQDPQALMLTVATRTRTHIKSLAPQRTVVKTPDLKIEVFLNGALMGSEYINPRRANVNISTNVDTRFSGMRIHRQIEKPWVYREAGQAIVASQTAQSRWDTISAALAEEAHDRGVDEDGSPSPSAAFLSALATVPLPEHVKDASHLAVIDIVISTGNGKKHGSESGFVLEPLRMESKRFKKAACQMPGETPAPNTLRSTSPGVLVAQRAGEPPKKKARHRSGRVDSRISPPVHDQDRADLALELGASPTGRLVKQIAPSLPVTPSARRRQNGLTQNGTIQSPIKIKINTALGTAKSWIKKPLPTSSDDYAAGGMTDGDPSSEPSDSLPVQAHTKTSRSAKGDPYTDEEALENFEPPELCKGSAVSFAGASMYRMVPRWRPGYFDEEEVVGGMRIVVT